MLIIYSAENFPKNLQQDAKIVFLSLFRLFNHYFFHHPDSVTENYCNQIHSSFGIIEKNFY